MLISKKIYRPIIYFFQHNASILPIGNDGLPPTIVATLIDEHGIIIWKNQGMFRLISNTVIHNLKTDYETARSLNALYPRMKVPAHLNEISWNQGIPISPEIVKILLSTTGKKSDSFGDSDASTETANKDHTD